MKTLFLIVLLFVALSLLYLFLPVGLDWRDTYRLDEEGKIIQQRRLQ